MSNRNLTIGLVVAIVIAIAGLFAPVLPNGQSVYQGITTGTNFKYGISVGNTAALGVVPTNFSKILGGTCSLIAGTYTIAASSSIAVDCAVTGAVSGDLVQAWFATSTSNGAGWLVTQSSASSTAGFITLRIVNNNGVSLLLPASIASSTNYVIWSTQ